MWLALTTILLVIPGNTIPSASWLDKIYFDKWVHAGLFGILTWIWCWALAHFNMKPAGMRRAFLLIAILALGYGIGMEFVQKYWASQRGFELLDMCADALGAAIAYFFSSWYFIKK